MSAIFPSLAISEVHNKRLGRLEQNHDCGSGGVRLVSLPYNAVALGLLLFIAGCGAAVQKSGTEQLVLSDSVDRAIDQLDLSPLAGRTVFLDTAYMQTFKGPNVYVNSDYIVSALRQKLTTTGCRLELNRTEADYILEARVGALGTDTMEVTYGIPSSNGLGVAATAISGVPAVPAIPEISVGKRNNMMGVSKVVVFAYHRDTGIPVWQSGAAVSRSDAKDSWFMGVGPLTRGSVYNGVTLAGNKINGPFDKKKPRQVKPLTIADRHSYVHPAVLEKQLADAKANEAEKKTVQQASHEEGSATPADGATSLVPLPVPPAEGSVIPVPPTEGSGTAVVPTAAVSPAVPPAATEPIAGPVAEADAAPPESLFVEPVEGLPLPPIFTGE